MTDEQTVETEKPFLLIEPKVSGYGLVFKKDGSISVPQPKEKEDGCNSDDSGT